MSGHTKIYNRHIGTYMNVHSMERIRLVYIRYIIYDNKRRSSSSSTKSYLDGLIIITLIVGRQLIAHADIAII